MRYVIELDIDPGVATPEEIARAMEIELSSIYLPNGDALYLDDVFVRIEEVGNRS